MYIFENKKQEQKTNGFRQDMVNQNKIFLFERKRHAKNVFLSDVERTVVKDLRFPLEDITDPAETVRTDKLI